jgi:hypothetical protein
MSPLQLQFHDPLSIPSEIEGFEKKNDKKNNTKKISRKLLSIKSSF